MNSHIITSQKIKLNSRSKGIELRGKKSNNILFIGASFCITIHHLFGLALCGTGTTHDET